ARFLRKEFFEFYPQFLIMMDTNYKPKFKGQYAGLWRRVKLIPFLRRFAPDERDHELENKLKAESEGSLAWAACAAAEGHRAGLQGRDVTREATTECRETSDARWGFFPGVLERGSEDDVRPGAKAFKAYIDW